MNCVQTLSTHIFPYKEILYRFTLTQRAFPLTHTHKNIMPYLIFSIQWFIWNRHIHIHIHHIYPFTMLFRYFLHIFFSIAVSLLLAFLYLSTPFYLHFLHPTEIITSFNWIYIRPGETSEGKKGRTKVKKTAQNKARPLRFKRCC